MDFEVSFSSFFTMYFLEIAYLYALAHFFQASGKLLDQIHLDIKIDGKVGILVGGVYCSAHVKIDVGRFLKQESAD